jgi:hypothetical protein
MTWQGDGAYPTTNNMRTVYLGNAGKTVEVTEGSAGDVWLQVCAIRGNVDIGQTNHGNYYQRDIKRDVSKLLCASANGKWMFI